jgi:hypothetical protein
MLQQYLPNVSVQWGSVVVKGFLDELEMCKVGGKCLWFQFVGYSSFDIGLRVLEVLNGG